MENNLSPRKYIKHMTKKQRCNWIAFINALRIIDLKAESLGLDPDSIDLPNVKIYKAYIEPKSETIEYYMDQNETDEFAYFFSDGDL